MRVGAKVQFGSSLVLDGGGTGMRADVLMNDGTSFPLPGDQFRGVAKVRYSEMAEPKTPLNVGRRLATDFVARRLRDTTHYHGKTIRDWLRQEPLERVYVSTAGQIKSEAGTWQITAAGNLSPELQDTNFLDPVRKAFVEAFDEQGESALIDASAFTRQGGMFNDALAGVMALAQTLEGSTAPLTPDSPARIFMDVGSGIATGGIQGNRLFTAESQNVRLAKGKTAEDTGSLRGITQQAIYYLKLQPEADRMKNPIYTALRQVALAQDAKSPMPQFDNQPAEFDRKFRMEPIDNLQHAAWKQNWVSQPDLMKRFLQGEARQNPVIDGVMNDFFDGLAQLAAFKVMEHKAETVHLQSINMDEAVEEVNRTRADGTLAVTNPLTAEVTRRMREKYLNTAIADQFFQGVQPMDVRNMEGLGYLPVALSPGRANPWHIGGLRQEQFASLV